MSAPGQRPVHVPADGGESVFLVGDTYTTLLSGTQTGGVFTLLEALVLPEAGPPPHAHHGEEETFFLLQGHMVFTVGGQTYDAHPGSAIYVPRNVAHSYQNVGAAVSSAHRSTRRILPPWLAWPKSTNSPSSRHNVIEPRTPRPYTALAARGAPVQIGSSCTNVFDGPVVNDTARW